MISFYFYSSACKGQSYFGPRTFIISNCANFSFSFKKSNLCSNFNCFSRLLRKLQFLKCEGTSGGGLEKFNSERISSSSLRNSISFESSLIIKKINIKN